MTDEITKVVATNRKAGFEYFIVERFDAGLVLQGSEIKSIRAGQISITEAYVEISAEEEAWLLEAHIAPYLEANRFNHDAKRPRRLLLHRKEILRLFNSVKQKGMTIIPLKVYISKRRAKIEIALAKGKKLYDKRDAIAKRDEEREEQRNLKG